METTFGTRIRDLRKQKGFSLRRLADEVRIDFTYLSKVETGRIPPPSEEAIARLAGALNADIDELLSLANKVDSKLHEFVVGQPEVPKLLRAWKDGRIDAAKRIIEGKAGDEESDA